MKSNRLVPVWWLLCLTALIVVGASGLYVLTNESVPAESSSSSGSTPAVSVDVTAPRAGGIDRLCTQPGSFEAFQSAELYAKVSGFLIEQNVDIGYPVRKGDILARIAVPEYEKQVKQDTAEVERARAKVEQMTAAVTTAEADLGTATTAIALAKAEAKSKVSYREFTEKQRNRIRELVEHKAIDAKVADETEHQYQAAYSAELAATEAVNSAKQKEVAAAARVKQAKADLKFAESEVTTAQARLERDQVFVDYAVIRAPYTGVVTKRSFHPGDFVRSADAGGDRVPLLVVERTDVMRVVVHVPERDVPFADVGDPAIVQVDALSDTTFKTTGTEKVEISRIAASEDPHTRMMRVEVHLNNPNGKLRRGMFGRVTLLLQAGVPAAVRVPSSAIQGKAAGGQGFVRIVKDDAAQIVAVRYGADNGTDVEILSGLTPTDRVIVRAIGTIENGTRVNVTNVTPAQAAKTTH